MTKIFNEIKNLVEEDIYALKKTFTSILTNKISFAMMLVIIILFAVLGIVFVDVFYNLDIYLYSLIGIDITKIYSKDTLTLEIIITSLLAVILLTVFYFKLNKNKYRTKSLMERELEEINIVINETNERINELIQKIATREFETEKDVGALEIKLHHLNKEKISNADRRILEQKKSDMEVDFKTEKAICEVEIERLRSFLERLKEERLRIQFPHISSYANTLQQSTGIKKDSDILQEYTEIDVRDMIKKTEEPSRTYMSMLDEIKKDIRNKIKNAEEKADELLNQGRTFGFLGALAFIIGACAIVMFNRDVKMHEVSYYAALANTTLFLFVEFMAAWSLKQYKYFTDLAIYYSKFGSIFEKYQLAYLASKDLCDDWDYNQKRELFLKLHEHEIKFPESYHLKKADISFAKEAMDSMQSMAKTIGELSKKKKDNE